MTDLYGGRWRIKESLDEGGQAHVFIVDDDTRDDIGDETHVLKRLKNPEKLERFKNEVEAGLKLQHKNIIRVVDWGLDGPRPYIVTVYCRGGSLTRARPFDNADHGRLLDLFGQICDGVLYAHGEKVIHRDLKPDNVYLWGDRHGDAVVGDFGLCFLDSGERVTLTDEPVGARNYMAPELEDGRADQVSPLSDVYSLGKILYWLLSGGKIFSREKHREREFDLVRVMDNIFLEHASRLLDRMVTLEPRDRWPLDMVRNQVKVVKRLIVGEYNPVGPSVAARCYYCGIGFYRLVAHDSASAAQIDVLPEGQPGDWRILVCGHCGHAQTFRPDLAVMLTGNESPW